MINVIDEYTDFVLDEFCFYGKKIMEKYYISSIFNSFTKEYILIRYYNIYSDEKNISNTVNYYLNQKIKELESENSDKIKNIYFMAAIFKYLIVLDGDLEANKVNKIENELQKIRKKHGIEEELEFSKEYREYRKRKRDFVKNFESENFEVEYTKTKIKNLFDTVLNHNIKISDLYSEKAINEVYNTGITSEDKLFVQYNLITIKVLNEIINYDYNTNYLVEFNTELFNKKDKLNRLLKIINNDIAKEKIILKIQYTKFIENKDEIFSLINEGYNVAIIKDENYKEDSYIKLFKYILD